MRHDFIWINRVPAIYNSVAALFGSYKYVQKILIIFPFCGPDSQLQLEINHGSGCNFVEIILFGERSLHFIFYVIKKPQEEHNIKYV